MREELPRESLQERAFREKMDQTIGPWRVRSADSFKDMRARIRGITITALREFFCFVLNKDNFNIYLGTKGHAEIIHKFSLKYEDIQGGIIDFKVVEGGLETKIARVTGPVAIISRETAEELEPIMHQYIQELVANCGS